MPRPPDLPIVDLMVELPRGGSGMGMDEARRLLKDPGSDEFGHHPAEYLFKDASDRMSEQLTIDGLVALMDHHGITTAQIDVNPVRPEESHEIFDRHPGRFFGSVGIDPNLGMKSLRSMRRAVESHPSIRSVSAAPCLYAPQVAIDAAQMYPFYAACCELDVPMNILAGVPGPRVPFDCQRVERIDPVCYDFPELKLVMRHGCEPWEALAVKLMLKWPNLYFSKSCSPDTSPACPGNECSVSWTTSDCVTTSGSHSSAATPAGCSPSTTWLPESARSRHDPAPPRCRIMTRSGT